MARFEICENKVNVKEPSKSAISIWNYLTNVSRWPEIIKLQNKPTKLDIVRGSSRKSLKPAESNKGVNALPTIKLNNNSCEKHVLVYERIKPRRNLRNSVQEEINRSSSGTSLECEHSSSTLKWLQKLSISSFYMKDKSVKNNGDNLDVIANNDIIYNSVQDNSSNNRAEIKPIVLEKIKQLEIQINDLQCIYDSCKNDSNAKINNKSKMLKRESPNPDNLVKVTTKHGSVFDSTHNMPVNVSESHNVRENDKKERKKEARLVDGNIKNDRTKTSRKEKINLTVENSNGDVLTHKSRDKKLQKGERNIRKMNKFIEAPQERTIGNTDYLINEDKPRTSDISCVIGNKIGKRQHPRRSNSPVNNLVNNIETSMAESNNNTIAFLLKKLKHLEIKLYNLSKAVNETRINNNKIKAQTNKSAQKHVHKKRTVNIENIAPESEEVEIETEDLKDVSFNTNNKQVNTLDVVPYTKINSQHINDINSTCIMKPVDDYSITSIISIDSEHKLKEIDNVVPCRMKCHSTQMNKHYFVSVSVSDTSLFNKRVMEIPTQDRSITVNEMLCPTMTHYPYFYKHLQPTNTEVKDYVKSDYDELPTKDTHHQMLVRSLSPMYEISKLKSNHECSSGVSDAAESSILINNTKQGLTIAQSSCINERTTIQILDDSNKCNLHDDFVHVTERDKITLNDKNIVTSLKGNNINNCLTLNPKEERFHVLRRYITAEERKVREGIICDNEESRTDHFPTQSINEIRSYSLNGNKSICFQGKQTKDNSFRENSFCPTNVTNSYASFKPCCSKECTCSLTQIIDKSWYNTEYDSTSTINANFLNKKQKPPNYVSGEKFGESFKNIDYKLTTNTLTRDHLPLLNVSNRRKSVKNIPNDCFTEKDEATFTVALNNVKWRSRSMTNVHEAKNCNRNRIFDIRNKSDVPKFLEISKNTVAYLVLVDKINTKGDFNKNAINENELEDLIVHFRDRIDNFIEKKQKRQITGGKIDAFGEVVRSESVNYEQSRVCKNRLVRSEELVNNKDSVQNFQSTVNIVDIKQFEHRTIKSEKENCINTSEGNNGSNLELDIIKECIDGTIAKKNSSIDNMALNISNSENKLNSDVVTTEVTTQFTTEVVEDNKKGEKNCLRKSISINKSDTIVIVKKHHQIRSKSVDCSRSNSKCFEYSNIVDEDLPKELDVEVKKTPEIKLEEDSVQSCINESASLDTLVSCNCVNAGINICFPPIDLINNKGYESETESSTSGIYRRFYALLKRRNSHEIMKKRISQLQHEMSIQKQEMNDLKYIWSKCSSQDDCCKYKDCVSKSNITFGNMTSFSETRELVTQDRRYWNLNSSSRSNKTDLVCAFQNLANSSRFLSEVLQTADICSNSTNESTELNRNCFSKFLKKCNSDKGCVLLHEGYKTGRSEKTHAECRLAREKRRSQYSMNSNGSLNCNNDSEWTNKGTQTDSSDVTSRKCLRIQKGVSGTKRRCLKVKKSCSRSKIINESFNSQKDIHSGLRQIKKKNNKVFIKDTTKCSTDEQSQV